MEISNTITTIQFSKLVVAYVLTELFGSALVIILLTAEDLYLLLVLRLVSLLQSLWGLH